MFAKKLLFALSLVLNLVLIYNLIWGQRGAIAYKELKERCSIFEKKISELGADNLAISREIRLLQSDEKYIEKVIRNRLNFVRNNEILYLFPEEAKDLPLGDLPNEAED